MSRWQRVQNQEGEGHLGTESENEPLGQKAWGWGRAGGEGGRGI